MSEAQGWFPTILPIICDPNSELDVDLTLDRCILFPRRSLLRARDSSLAHKYLEAKLAEVEKKQAEKSSELIRKEGEFELKRKTDSDTIQKQQKELGGLRNYMKTVEKHWDLLNEDVMGIFLKFI
jgi:hypothetical protein